MNSILGIDIGSRSIKLIEIGKDKTGPVLLAAGSIPTPPNALTSQADADAKALGQAITKLVHDSASHARTVNLALPESQVFTRVIEMPSLSTRELSSALQWEAEQYIPLPLDQVNMDFSILRSAKETKTNKMDVLLVASPKALPEKYVGYAEMADLVVTVIETEIIAASRSLLQSTRSIRTSMIVSLGAQTTDLAIVRDGILAFTRSISAGGNALTRSIAQGLGLEVNQAEEFKRTYGLEPDKAEGKITAAAKPILDTIIGEMKRAVAFYQEKFSNETIQVILLSGGNAKIPGMVVYIAQQMGASIEIQIANPWAGIRRDPRFAVLDSEGPIFSVAVGLALR